MIELRQTKLGLRAAALAFAAGTCAIVLAGGASAGTKKLTIYSVATAVQYINNADDAARGVSNNPFSSKTNKLQPNETRTGDGPFPGDVAVYSFDLFRSSNLKKPAGQAAYTCYYNYVKHALCMAYFNLNDGGGTLTASGPVDFGNTHFKLVVTGGTKNYLGSSGEMTAASVPKNAQRLDFVLLDQ